MDLKRGNTCYPTIFGIILSLLSLYCALDIGLVVGHVNGILAVH